MSEEYLILRLRIAAELADVEDFSHTAIALRQIAHHMVIDYMDTIDTWSIQAGTGANALSAENCTGQSLAEAKGAR